jgi:hydrogenase maturation protein HypF
MDAVPGRATAADVSERLSLERLQVRVLGVVQGVGFRPFVYRLATELGLRGWVCNDGLGVLIEVEGPPAALLEFLERLPREKPPPAFLYAFDHRFLEPVGYPAFTIRESQVGEVRRVWILPDLAVCSACRREVLDPVDRRYGYPFTNCTHCGPRFTIIEDLPYDRPRTSMKVFRMCPECEREYHDPQDRRFHAQPNACPRCGPRLEVCEPDGTPVAWGDEALRRAAEKVRMGAVIALKGLGGYHLVVDARDEPAVARLRARKRRPSKAFAVMYPDLETLRRHVEVSPLAETLLTSPQAPILLLPRTPAGWQEIAPSVAPRSPYLGVFLPYTPLHILLLHELGFPVVATSGNLSDDPIQYRDEEALQALGDLCDGFLRHDRPIVRHADDSVLQIVTRPRVRPQLLRRARGYTPLPLLAPRPLPPLLALGGHMNVTFALSRGPEIILSQHIGDLDGYEARQVYRRTLEDFLRLYDVRPQAVAHDLHPDYFTTRLAEEWGVPRFPVQHHHAHLAACMLENQLEGPVLGLTWDGTGYGPDGTVWGGEFLMGDPRSFRRVASLWPFRLPTGEKAVREPWRVALALLWESFGPDVPRDLPLFREVPERSVEIVLQVLRKDLLSPVTTSMGRLFDGVSALLGISFYNSHQAESAQLLEYAAWAHGPGAFSLPLPLRETDVLRLDWRELVRALVDRFRRGVPAEALAAAFHEALAGAAIAVVERLQTPRIVMAGGVFCNRYLTEALLTRLEERGLQAFIHTQLPPTDGSLAVGQLWVAAHRLEDGE